MYSGDSSDDEDFPPPVSMMSEYDVMLLLLVWSSFIDCDNEVVYSSTQIVIMSWSTAPLRL